jgi:hypothetical protein
MDDSMRRKIIINYIDNNQGCSAQQIVDGVINDISRRPVFDTLRSLVKEGAVLDEKVNRRDHRYFLATNNPIISVQKELEELKTYFNPFVEKAKQELSKHLRMEYDEKLRGLRYNKEVLMHTLEIFQELVNIYTYRALLIWPRRIKDPETLNRLYLTVFNEILRLQLEIINKFRSLFKNPNDFEEAIVSRMPMPTAMLAYHISGQHPGQHLLRNFQENNMEKEAKPLVDFLVKIGNELKFQTHFLEFFGKLDNEAYEEFKKSSNL